eukprot:CAMPEP_0194328224 /NCGR_PEP_ID=MMETSP0171-20130528/43915_1 /TAXON_ID=218684 /ORGANISM="Corethron pennatum, Strain L29A3" /LENGTH=538 /DNA_ID=CAMNT_0039088473 /DNA_START=65 /DNA_END=1677 /DNA_ORIENTATION=-
MSSKTSSHESSPLQKEIDELLSLPPMLDSHGLKIAIIGAGVAGLLTARVLKSRGFTDLTLFEASSKVGGVWLDGYPNFAIQTPGSLYEFPDKPMKGSKDFKDGAGIQQYMEEYAEENGLQKIFQFNKRVQKIEKDSLGWKLTVNSKELHSFDFVVLATGLYSAEHKFVPKIEGMDMNFQGSTYHTQDTGGIKDRKGKKVIVVGFGKSAQDCAMNAYKETGVPPTLLFRSSHWCVPRKVLGLIPMEWLIYSRFGQGTLPRWKECGPVEAIFHTIGWPLIWIYWRIVEMLFTFQLGWYGKCSHLRPSLAIEQDMYCGHGVICHPDMFPMTRRGEIKAVKGEIEKVLESGKLLLKDGTEVEADEIVFATGFRRQLGFLPEELKRHHEDDGIFAYRNMMVPGVKNICFLNSNVTTFSNITTPGLQAAWLAELLEGKLELKNIKEDLEDEKIWRRSRLAHADGDFRAIFVQLHQIRYWDTLLKDMGINVKRKGGFLSAFKNFFFPIASSDYKSVITGDYQEDSSEYRAKGYSPTYWCEWLVLG